MSHFHYKVFRGNALIYDSGDPPLSHEFQEGDYCMQKDTLTGHLNWYVSGDRIDAVVNFRWTHIQEEHLPKAVKLMVLVVA